MSREQNDPVTAPDRADYDSLWKKALEVYFREFTDFFFPEVVAKDNATTNFISY